MDKKIEIENWETETTKEYHKKQYIEPKRSTAAFHQFLEKHDCLTGEKCILDIGCGGGANDVYFASRHPQLKIEGIDAVSKFFGLFDQYADCEMKQRVKLIEQDLYDLDSSWNRFEGVISLQTISWLEDWKGFFEKVCSLNPEWIAVSSLFYEGRIDYQIKLKDYEDRGITQPCTEKYYNIYSLPLIREYLEDHGYKRFCYEAFDIDIDLPKPDSMGLGTYTVKTEYGKRIQISGALMMPWYFLYASKA